MLMPAALVISDIEAAFAAGEDERAKELLEASLAFEQEHLMRWVPQFAKILGGGEGFYPAVALLFDAFLKKDELLLKELLDI